MMKTKHTNTWMVFTMLLIFSCAVQAQHTEIEYDSNGGDPQLLLKESGTGGGFSRLTMQNTLPGFWTLAARNGLGSSDDDFNIYYEDGADPGYNILNIDGDTEDINFTARDLSLFGRTNSAVMTIDTDDTNDDAKLTLRSASDAWSIAADGGFNRMTMSAGSSRFFDVTTDGDVGINATPVDGTSLSVSGQGPHMRIQENNNSGFSELNFANFGVSDTWSMEANSQYVNGNSAASNKADFRLRFDDDGVNKDLISAVYGVDVLNGPKVIRVGINDVSPEYTLSVDHPSGSPNNGTASGGNTINGSRYGFNIQNTSNNDSWTMYTRTSSNGDLRLYYDNNTTDNIDPVLRGTFNSSDGVYTENSDLRLKKNITNLDNQLEKVLKLRPTRYQFKDQEDGDYSLGLIAQEVKDIFPDIVDQVTTLEEDGTDYMGIGYSKFIPVLIGAIQEQQDIIEAKTKDMETLKSEMASLKAIVNALTAEK